MPQSNGASQGIPYTSRRRYLRSRSSPYLMQMHLLGFLLLAPGLASTQSTPPYLVKGQIGHLNAPSKIYLVYGPQVLDSATLKNGQFELRGSDG